MILSVNRYNLYEMFAIKEDAMRLRLSVLAVCATVVLLTACLPPITPGGDPPETEVTLA